MTTATGSARGSGVRSGSSAVGGGSATRRWRIVALFVVLTVVASACTAYENRQFKVQNGYGWYIHISQKPTWQVVTWNDAPRNGALYCGGDELCTLAFLDQEIDVGWIGNAYDIDYFFDSDQEGDFRQALDGVRGTNKCLLMHRKLVAADRHNWTQSSPGSSCVGGELLSL